MLYEAAHVIICKPVKGCTTLKSWAMRIAKRSGIKKATVALARKLAVIMHRMLADGTPFVNQPARRIEEKSKALGVKTPHLPKRGPDAGTMDQVRPRCRTWH